jgi:chromosome segregation ATPase
MLGRKQQRIDDLERTKLVLEHELADVIHLKALNVKLNDRITVMQQHVSDAEQGREEANERAHDYARQIDHLAKWFMDNAPDRIREGGAVNNAIVLLNEVLRLEDDVTTYADSLNKRMAELSEAENRIGLLDSELKQLRIERDQLVKNAAKEIDPKIVAQVEDALDHPETFVKRGRPQRKP